MDYCKIGEKIRKYRKAKGLSQEELAEKINISVTHMSHIETGNTKMSLSVFVDLANALEVQTDDLLYDVYKGRKIAENDLHKILDSCNEQQIKFILDVIRATKISLEKHF